MAKSKSSSVPTRSPSPPDDTERPLGPLSTSIPSYERFPVKVNNANATELKLACDDALKRYLSRPQLFNQIYQHTDVKLALGWASVIVAGGTGFYSYKVDFETSKPVLWFGMITYLLLTTLQTLYSYFIEGSTVFIGKRKTFSKRIVTERLTITSSNIPIPSASSTLAGTSKKFTSPSVTSVPSYQIQIQYIRTTSNNKSLIKKGKVTSRDGYYNKWFDEEGVMDQEGFERWVGEFVESAMEGKTN